MSDFLMVPMHVDGLHLTDLRRVVGPSADFRRLPYTADRGTAADPRWVDVNATTPWLGSSLRDEALDDADLWLRPGVHLHWSLPDGLCRATHPVSGGQQDRSRVVFPAVPNRWLVVRTIGGSVDARWLVESDYVWSPAEKWPPQRAHEPDELCVFPWDPGGTGTPPWRYVGRRGQVPAGSRSPVWNQVETGERLPAGT